MNRANRTICGEPTGRRENVVVPVVPGVVPPFCEGGSHGSRGGSQNAVVVPRVPPIGGTGDQGPGNRPSWYPKNQAKHRLGKHRCGQITMVALDHWTAAMPVQLDPWPLSPAGEVEALRAGRRTYQIRHWGVRHRNAYRIAGNPPGPRTTVLAEHRCGEVTPETWRQPPPRKPTTNNTQEVPF